MGATRIKSPLAHPWNDGRKWNRPMNTYTTGTHPAYSEPMTSVIGYKFADPVLDPDEPGIEWEERKARFARRRATTALALELAEQGHRVDTVTDSFVSYRPDQVES